MPVFRVERNKGYTVMSNYHLRDKSLSLKAKGLLSQILSLPEDWDYTLSGLCYINRESKDAIIGNTSIDITSVVIDLDTRLSAMDIGGLLGLWFQSLFVGLTMNILSICIMLVVYGRMIEIYLVTSLGPIPLATIGNSEWRGMGQGYLKSLFALGFQAFLIMVVTGIYAVLVQSIALSADVSGAIWGCMGYTVLLCFCLFKTGSIAKAVFAVH